MYLQSFSVPAFHYPASEFPNCHALPCAWTPLAYAVAPMRASWCGTVTHWCIATGLCPASVPQLVRGCGCVPIPNSWLLHRGRGSMLAAFAPTKSPIHTTGTLTVWLAAMQTVCGLPVISCCVWMCVCVWQVDCLRGVLTAIRKGHVAGARLCVTVG